RQPTFSGTAEPGSTVNIIDNGKVIGTATVGDDGKWTFTPDAPLDNGNHDFTTTVTDEAGNTGPEGEHLTVKVDGDLTKATITKVVDDQGSVTGDIAQNGVTDDTRPQLVGTAKAGSIVTLWDGENKLGETTAKSDGSWSFTPSVDLGKGSHTLTAKAKDPMGNESTSNSWTLTIDTDAPVKPTIDGAYDDVGNVQGELKHGGATDDPTPTLNGKAEAGSTVKIYDQSGLIGSVTAKSDGSWSFTPDALLSEGKHTFYVTATDKAGNTSVRSDNFDLTLDFTPPDPTKLSITDVVDDYGERQGSVAQNGKTDDNTPLLKGTGAEDGNIIRIYATNAAGTTTEVGSAKVVNGEWEFQVTTPMKDGTYTFTVSETDPVGNVSGPKGDYVVTIDQGGQPAAPTLSTVEDDVGTKTGILQKGDFTDDNELKLTGTAEDGTVVRIYGGADGKTLLGSAKVEGGAWTFTTPKLADGVHSFVAEAVNDIGQVSPQTGGFQVTVDTKAPDAVTGFKVMDDEGPQVGELRDGDRTDDATPTISGKAEPGSTVHVYVNGKEDGTVTADADGNWEYTTSTLDGSGGGKDYTLTARAEDAAGNLGPANTGMTIT
ncbi:Ig-like domain-containing protein, partial [Enterobacillus tribolii]|uniref:Ig-like domain-containing protein n=1 Tax=Enterobacillus tribolii TaxID=1487935 RepID=UPI001D81AEE4